MPILSKEKTPLLPVEVVDIIYCGVVVKAINADGEVFYFVIEQWPQNTKQNTKPVDDSAADAPWPDRSKVDMKKARAYWTSHVEKNADGTRKGGAFSEANFSLKGIPMGAILDIEFVKVSDINHEVMVHYGDAEPFKAFACAKPSPQYAVDTYIVCFHKGKLYIRAILRAGASSKGPDYYNGLGIIGGFLNGGLTVAQGRAAELLEEGGIVIGDTRVIVLNLGERSTRGRDPRYMPHSYVDAETGDIVYFGVERGSTADAVVHFVISNDPDTLPRLAKATDEAEVVKGEWMLLSEFLAKSNDPAAGEYVAWLDHQAGARDAARLLVEEGLVPSAVIEGF
jgi:hypothetical protein